MASSLSPPDNPVGPFEPQAEYSDETRDQLIDVLRQAPANLRAAVAGLTDEQLDTKYRNWTIRQIVHHLADSHVQSYIRFKWTQTEDHPTIKADEEADWVALPDAAAGDIAPALALYEAMHQRWLQSLLTMTEPDFARTFHHPQSDETVTLWQALNYYPWHSRHHTGQILWLREQHD